jgi:hypothetical protein
MHLEQRLRERLGGASLEMLQSCHVSRRRLREMCTPIGDCHLTPATSFPEVVASTRIILEIGKCTWILLMLLDTKKVPQWTTIRVSLGTFAWTLAFNL